MTGEPDLIRRAALADEGAEVNESLIREAALELLAVVCPPFELDAFSGPRMGSER